MIYRVTAHTETVERVPFYEMFEPEFWLAETNGWERSTYVTVFTERHELVYEGPSYNLAATGCSIYEAYGWRTTFEQIIGSEGM